MAISITGSFSGINTVRNLSIIKKSLDKTMKRLSSGERITSAADEPASLVISEKMRSQIGSLTQQIKNLELNLNKNETAGNSVQELRSKLIEMRKIALSAADDSNNSNETGQMFQQQIDDLMTTYNNQVADSSFGTQKLLDGSENAILDLTEVSEIDVARPENAQDSINEIDSHLRELDRAQAKLGAKTKYDYESTISALEVSSQNLTAAESIIRDTDYALEQANYIKQIIQINAGIAVISQGNLASESVFRLLHA